MKKVKLFILLSLLCIYMNTEAQTAKWNSPQAGNPVIPGHFADPTVQKFGDTYYLYCTTDGTAGGLGPSQVWTSKDFVNWTIKPMNWPPQDRCGRRISCRALTANIIFITARHVKYIVLYRTVLQDRGRIFSALTKLFLFRTGTFPCRSHWMRKVLLMTTVLLTFTGGRGAFIPIMAAE